MPGRFDQQPMVPQLRLRRELLLPSLLLIATAILLTILPAYAEVRTVTAQGEHRMGDRDTREDAVRLATESAKRNALEQVATYLESVTVVDGMDVTKDEIRTYTAGLVLVLEQQTNTTLDGETIVIKVDLVAQIDTEEVAQAITALRENEDARVQLAAMKLENEQLQQELNAANQALANASTSDQAQLATQQRQEILNRVQSNAIVSQAWTDWVLISPGVYGYPGVGLTHPQAMLTIAQGLYPANPHIIVAQQAFSHRQPSSQWNRPRQMPTHAIVPGPGSQGTPRTLNEFTYRTPPSQSYIGTQRHDHERQESQTLTGVTEVHPFLAPGFGSQQPSRHTRRIPQFQEQGGGFGRSQGSDSRSNSWNAPPREGGGGFQPGTGGLPPSVYNLPSPGREQAPQMPPRSFRNGGQHGGGGGPAEGGFRGGGGGNNGGGGRGGGKGR